MSLSPDDMQLVRSMIGGALTENLEPVRGEVEAQREDIKELYVLLMAHAKKFRTIYLTLRAQGRNFEESYKLIMTNRHAIQELHRLIKDTPGS